MVSPGTVFAIVLNGLVLGVVGLAAGYLWMRRDGGDDRSVEEWYAQARSLAREVQRLDDPATAVADHDRIQREILPLSGRLQGHARGAPAAVEERHVADLYRLGGQCSRIGLEHARHEAAKTGHFLEVKLERLGEEAESFEAMIAVKVDEDFG